MKRLCWPSLLPPCRALCTPVPAEAQLQSSFPIYIPKTPSSAALLPLQPARCVVQVWEGDSPRIPHRLSASCGSRCFPGTGNSKHTQMKSQISPVWPHPLSQQRVWTASMSLFLFLPEEVRLTGNSP